MSAPDVKGRPEAFGNGRPPRNPGPRHPEPDAVPPRPAREFDNGDRHPHDDAGEPRSAGAGDDASAPDEAAREQPDGDKRPDGGRRKLILLLVGGVVLAAAVAAGAYWYFHSRHYQTTDDAFVQAHDAAVATRLAGYVTDVRVNDNQVVRKGDVLATIDTRDLDAQFASARAQVASDQRKLDEARSVVKVREANVRQAEADQQASQTAADLAASDAARYASLPQGAVSASQRETQTSNAKTTAANVQSARSKVVSAEAELDNAKATVETAAAAVELSRRKADEVETTRAYATITAPYDGRVTRRSVERGGYVQAGQQLLALVPRDGASVYVEANFKETQLAYMRPGQPVSIRIDAYPDAEFQGRIDSIQAGSGPAFSLLPPENATGNYVKVVQRVPVKITFDPFPDPAKYLLGPGMSVEPRVDIRSGREDVRREQR